MTSGMRHSRILEIICIGWNGIDPTFRCAVDMVFGTNILLFKPSIDQKVLRLRENRDQDEQYYKAYQYNLFYGIDSVVLPDLSSQMQARFTMVSTALFISWTDMNSSFE